MDNNVDVLALVLESVAKAYKERNGTDFFASLQLLNTTQEYYLKSISGKIDQLLLADYNAAIQHLEYAQIRGRSLNQIVQDIAKAQNLLVKAIKQTSDNAQEAIVRIYISMCAYSLGDNDIANYEMDQAIEALKRHQESLSALISRIEHRMLENEKERSNIGFFGSTERKDRLWMDNHDLGYYLSTHNKKKAETQKLADYILNLRKDLNLL